MSSNSIDAEEDGKTKGHYLIRNKNNFNIINDCTIS